MNALKGKKIEYIKFWPYRESHLSIVSSETFTIALGNFKNKANGRRYNEDIKQLALIWSSLYSGYAIMPEKLYFYCITHQGKN